jgi:diguanylate cyclase (GGDEF)-like protein
MASVNSAEAYSVLRAETLARTARLRWGAVVLSLVIVQLQKPRPVSVTIALLIGLVIAAYNLPLLFAARLPRRAVNPVAVASIAADFLACTGWVLLTANDPNASTYVVYMVVAFEAGIVFRWKGTIAFVAAFIPTFAVCYYFRATDFHYELSFSHLLFRSGIVTLMAVLTGAIANASESLRIRLETTALDARRDALRLEAIYRVTQRANASLRREEVLEAAVDSLQTLFPHRWHGIMLFDESGGLTLAAGRGEPTKLSAQLPVGGSPKIFTRTLVSEDLWNDPHLDRVGFKPPVSLSAYHSAVTTPLGLRDVQFGALVSLDTERGAFDAEDVRLMEALGPQISTALENAHLYEEVERLSLTDPLTGLGNRRAFDQHLEHEVDRAKRYGYPLSLALIDIDHFKVYNDTHGHPAGDEVLRKLGHALDDHMIRRSDLAYRYGGEEFAVIMHSTRSDEALQVMRRMHDAVRLEPLPLGDHQPGGRLTVSVGVTTYDGAECSAQEVVDQADLALFAAKQEGRDCSVVYDSELGVSLTNWTRLLPSLMKEKAFESVYQPIVRLEDGAVTGYEALARPAGQPSIESVEGMFAAAHRMGWLLDLDWFCFRSAIEGASSLPAGTDLFVNITLTGLLDATRDPDRLELVLRSEARLVSDVVLEISEREAVTDIARLKKIVASYRELGFRFALDDVGEGHSTFEVLAAIEPEFIKIARSMVVGIEHPGARGAIRGMVEFAKTTGATVIAEGIETLQMTAGMQELGVEVGQGHALGRPAPLPVEFWPLPRVVAAS